MTIWKKAIILAAIGALAVTALADGASAQSRKHKPKTAETYGQRVVPREDYRSEQRSTFDYFFRNPSKYATYRNDPGEYWQGANRR